MPPQFTKEEWLTEVDETDGFNFPETPILTVTVHDEDETNKFQYKVRQSHNIIYVLPTNLTDNIVIITHFLFCDVSGNRKQWIWCR